RPPPAKIRPGSPAPTRRHQSSAPSALLHHVGSNTSQVASSGVWGLVRLRQTFVRCCLGHYKLVRATEGHEFPGQWKVAKQMVGRRLSQAEAKRLLSKFK